jgi:hypothetical protein
LPAATASLATLGLAETFSAVKTFTAAPVIQIDAAAGVTTLATLTKTTTGGVGQDNDGAKLSIIVENATDLTTEVASLQFVNTTAAKATCDTDVIISTMLGGAVSQAILVDASAQEVVIGANATDADGLSALRIYPVTTARGSLVLSCAAHASADRATTITNATDGGAAAIITLPSGTSKLAGMTTNTATTTDAATDAFPLTHGVIAKTLHASAKTLTLADGFPGQELFIYVSVDGGGKGTLTPTTKTGYTSVELDKAGDAVLLRFLPTVGWIILGAYGITTAPVILA